MRLLVSSLCFTLLTSHALAAADKPTISVYPKFQTAQRATVRVTVVIPRDKTNREACVDIEGENYSRSSCWEQPGEAGAYQTVIYYSDLPAGHYTAVAQIVRVKPDGSREEVNTAAFEFRIIGLGEAPDEEP